MTPAMMTFLTFFIYILICATYGTQDIIYPKRFENQQLATRIHCQVEETQHFRYSSVTKLWGIMGGDILLNADITLHCLGDDTGGKYESEALRYRAEVSNFFIEAKRENEERSSRRKRGVGDFFTNAWEKMKKFFKRVFKGEPERPQVTHAQDKPPDDRKEEEEEEFNINELQHLYSAPFQFVQLANGSIPEIRFAENEVDDISVKNFKRHLVDSFATHLNFNRKHKEVMETSLVGEHMSSYDITVNDGSASLHLAGWSTPKTEEPTIVVNKIITENDILKLAPSEAQNDRDKIELKLQQKQVFQDGKLLSSSGTSSLHVFHNSEMKKKRRKRDADEDVLSYFQAHSSFDIQLFKRQRRSAETFSHEVNDETPTYSPASRFAETQESSERETFRSFQQSNKDIAKVFQSLLNGEETDFDEKMQIIFEMVEREVKLNLDSEPNSASNTVRSSLTKEKMQDMCSKNFSFCKDFLQLLALAGGTEAEHVLLSLLSEENNLSPADIRMVADILSDVSRPSHELLDSLDKLISENKLQPDVLGSVCLGSASIGSGFKENEKSGISGTLVGLLRRQMNSCHSDPLILDVLEAIGNLECERTVPHVLEVSEKCRNHGGVQIGCAHALRPFVHHPSVQTWIQNMTANGDCDLTQAVVGTLLDKIQDQEMQNGVKNWPRYNFNEVDRILKKKLFESRCSPGSTVLYFSRKKNTEANNIAETYFVPETEPWNPGSSTRQKRAFWNDLNCNEWTEDSKYTPIQDQEEFSIDRETYNKRKSCLAYRRLGIKGANAEIYAGMFAGVKEPSDPPKYKLFTKFVSGLDFLGNQMEIGSFYFYHHSGRTKAYVRIMGKTRQEFTHDGCTPTDLKYRPLKHIPLYMVSISTVQLSLGIHLSSQLALDTDCPGNEVYQLQPLTDVRVGGEASATVALARGAVNLGGNFNYKLQFTFTPSPNMCLKGSHGYDPMSISFQTYYQLWNAVKNDWGKTRTWKPNFLSWNIRRGELKPLFDDACIATDDYPITANSERELE